MRRTPTYELMTKMFDKLTNATNTYLSRYCELIDEQD